ncbi:amino acid adenylation domain-containing protein [Streptomyces sp. NPDC056682]|uniref:amino acid adenylation domain-containing protein n=1 Tax=Streptomyces sp. NPDC056682 TaxID=3345909 RepID=UPI0036A91C1D
MLFGRSVRLTGKKSNSALGADTLSEAFASIAAQYPERSAVKCDGVTLSYAELDASSSALAARIQAQAAGPGRPVALLFERSADMVVAALAAVKAGSPYVPLDPAAPAGRAGSILADAQPSVVITSTDLKHNVPTAGIPVLYTDEPSESEQAFVPGTIKPSDCAYVIFTSGTTGRPKGVEVSHHNVLRLFTTTDPLFGFDCEDVWTMFHSFAFDFSVWEMWGALLFGGCLVIVPSNTAKDPLAFRRLLIDESVTVLSQTPTAFNQLIAEDVRHADTVPVEKIIFGGEALNFADLKPWLAKYDDDSQQLINMYGITEITIHATYRRVTGRDLDEERSLIGRPLPDLDILIVDETLAPVPPGEQGELVVTGPGVALGYLGRPELTAERFVELPGRDGRTLRGYRSGDLARSRPDGDLEYLGRSDDQVKIRGFRIELGEIEAALASHSAVQHSVVNVRTDQRGDKTLVGYVVPTSGAVPGEQELREHAARLLPDYMVPTTFVTIDAVPMTANGKLDRAALPEPRSANSPARTGRGPRSLREELLCGLFAEVLGRSTVSIDDDFVQLGGHSLMAIRLVNRIRAVLGLEVRIKDLFEGRSVAALAQQGPARQRLPLTPRAHQAEVPLSFAQQRLWLLQHVHGENPAYHIPYALHLTGRVDAEALRSALRDVVARHEVLRTLYPDRDGTPYQRILDPDQAVLELEVTRLSSDQLDERVHQVAREPFDLASDLPLRSALFLLDEEHSVLVLVLHHIAGDGWSLEPLMRDLAQAYTARLAGRAPGWEPLPVQYADFAVWQRELLGDPDDPDSISRRQLDFWTEFLQDAPPELDLPADRARPSTASFRGGMVPVDLDADLHTRLATLARQTGTTVNMALQAAVAGLLTRLGAGTDIPIGNAIAGRTDDAVHHLVGFFVNTLVTRTDTSGDPSFVELLRRVRAGNLAAYDHEDLPFERLVEFLNPVRSAARHPLFQVMLASQSSIPVGTTMGGLTVDARPINNGTAKFDLSFKFDEHRTAEGGPDGVVGVVEFNGDLFDRASAERIGARLTRLLRAAVSRPDLPLGSLDILDEDERAQLVTGWNDTTTALPDTATVGALVERQVDRTPEAVALVQGQTRWTYHRLDQRANQYARLLHGMGAGPESRIGLCMARGPELVAAVLGVWKAGAAYVPLDPDYPADRLSYMFADSGATVLLTEGDLADGLTLPPAAQVLRTDADPRLRTAATDRLPQTAQGRNLAYVIYTSGSTGRPKSVMIEHVGVVNRLRDVVDRFGLTPDDVSLQITSIGFEPPVREIFGPLSVGASVALLPPEGARDPEIVVRTIRESRPTVILCVVPSLLESLIVYQADSSDFSSLRLVATGGEALRPAEAGELMDTWGCEVVNQYGPTETTMMACIHPVRPEDLAGRIPVGRPLANTRVYVLDAALRPAPIGVPGEVYLAGVGTGRGYLGQPALTSTRFVANPFGAPGERMYRSGDVARWRPDGRLEFVGRADDQVKVRGFRIELGEIETVLSAHPRVARAAVIVREDRPGDKRLAAYLVPTDPADRPEPAELRDHLAGQLPEHMVPAAFVWMDVLPLRGNGKLNRDLLPVPDLAPQAGFRAPRSPREEILCELFSEVLGVAPVGIDDDFFELGGHSLLAARLISRVRTVLGLELAMRSLFEAPRVAGLAQRLGSDGVDDSLQLLLPLRTQGDRPPLFCIHPGGGLSWSYAGLLKHIRPDVPLYGIQARGLLHPEDMPQTVEEMAEHYVQEIRAVQPEGPYHLLGWSFGGIVAYEMAVRLQEQGAEIGLLTLLDCYPGVPDYYRIDDRSMIVSLLDPSRPEVVPQEGSPEIAKAVEILKQDTGALASLNESQLVALLTTMSHNRHIVGDYKPKPFDGDVLFFLATEGRSDGAPTAEVWQQYVSGQVIWHPVNSTHTTMNHPEPLTAIGRILSEALDRLPANNTRAKGATQ